MTVKKELRGCLPNVPISIFGIITQVIIEILALSLAIFCYSHLRRGDYSVGECTSNFLKTYKCKLIPN